jgi:hypothetical protein
MCYFLLQLLIGEGVRISIVHYSKCMRAQIQTIRLSLKICKKVKLTRIQYFGVLQIVYSYNDRDLWLEEIEKRTVTRKNFKR